MRWWVKEDPEIRQSVEQFLGEEGATFETAQALALWKEISIIEAIDRLCASAERRRNRALQELNRHRDRKAFTKSLRETVHKIDDAAFNRDNKTEGVRQLNSSAA